MSRRSPSPTPDKPQAACVLLLDVSRSMRGAPLRALQQGLAAYRDYLALDPDAKLFVPRPASSRSATRRRSSTPSAAWTACPSDSNCRRAAATSLGAAIDLGLARGRGTQGPVPRRGRRLLLAIPRRPHRRRADRPQGAGALRRLRPETPAGRQGPQGHPAALRHRQRQLRQAEGAASARTAPSPASTARASGSSSSGCPRASPASRTPSRARRSRSPTRPCRRRRARTPSPSRSRPVTQHAVIP